MKTMKLVWTIALNPRICKIVSLADHLNVVEDISSVDYG